MMHPIWVFGAGSKSRARSVPMILEVNTRWVGCIPSIHSMYSRSHERRFTASAHHQTRALTPERNPRYRPESPHQTQPTGQPASSSPPPVERVTGSCHAAPHHCAPRRPHRGRLRRPFRSASRVADAARRRVWNERARPHTRAGPCYPPPASSRDNLQFDLHSFSVLWYS
jgi:hypothetical protein